MKKQNAMKHKYPYAWGCAIMQGKKLVEMCLGGNVVNMRELEKDSAPPSGAGPV